MIWFYRDFLDGFVYIIFAVLSLIFIMAIIGFIMERLQLEKEEKNRVAVLNPSSFATPVNDAASPSSAIVSEGMQEKNDNAVTNDQIPTVLDLNEIENGQQKS